MAKGDPKSVTVQYKVHLKPTEIGRLVIERLARPHVDVSPELRRFIELGYAAERAGFILDGTVLRHAGRAWDAQPDVSVHLEAEAVSTGATPNGRLQSSPVRQSDVGSAGSDVDQAKPNSTSESSDVPATSTSSLRGNLRGLSG